MKIFKGRVVGVKMAKTATVLVESVKLHPLYGKRVKRIKKYHLHDDFGVKVGDNVRFVASNPYSKIKKWKIVDIPGDKERRKL